MQDIGFDIISDLNLTETDSFEWNDKATSLYCIVAGNISSDLVVVAVVLSHLADIYQGVFFVPGVLEYETATNLVARTEELELISNDTPNVCMLYQHVVLIDGIALLGSNGWGEHDSVTIPDIITTATRLEDFAYLYKSVTKLQRHLDVKKIIIVSSAVPHDDLYFSEKPIIADDRISLSACLAVDTEHKVSHWIFGTQSKYVDTQINNVNYVNNPYSSTSPYWPKRLTLSL